MIVLNFRLLFNLTLLFPTPSLPPVEPILTPSLEEKLQPRGNFVFLYETVTKRDAGTDLGGGIGLPKSPLKSILDLVQNSF